MTPLSSPLLHPPLLPPTVPRSSLAPPTPSLLSPPSSPPSSLLTTASYILPQLFIHNYTQSFIHSSYYFIDPRSRRLNHLDNRLHRDFSSLLSQRLSLINITIVVGDAFFPKSLAFSIVMETICVNLHCHGDDMCEFTLSWRRYV